MQHHPPSHQPAAAAAGAPRPVRQALDPWALRLALLAAGAALAAFLANATHALLDDGPQLVQDFGNPLCPPLWNHVLYFPAARALGALPIRSDETLLLLSALSGAGLVGLCGLISWVATGRRGIAAAAAAAAMTAPVVVGHATFIEVHALHGFCVALGLLALLAAPSRRPAILVAAAIAGLLAGLSHRSAALLLPALTAVTTARLLRTELSPWPSVRLGGLAAAFGLTLAYGLDAALHALLGGTSLLGSLEQIHEAVPTPVSRMLLDETALALGPLLLLGGLGLSTWPWMRLATTRRAEGLRAAGAKGWAAMALSAAGPLALLPYCAAIVMAGVETHGGYWLGAVPFLLLGFALFLREHADALQPRRFGSGLLVATGLVASIGIAATNLYGDGLRTTLAQQRQARVAAAAALLPEGGTLVSTGLTKQYVDGATQGIREADFGSNLGRRLLAGEAPISLAVDVRRRIERLLAEAPGQPLLWTREWRLVRGLPPAFAAAMLQIEAHAFADMSTSETAFGEVDALLVTPVDGN